MKILPIPRLLAQHHGETLFGPMQEWLSQKKIPPVLLMTGTPGIGKREIGYFLAQWILCEKTGFSSHTDTGPDLFGGGFFPETAPTPAHSEETPGPCGQCPSCQRAIHNNWVDFHEILPEEEGGTLKIDQFRDLKGSLGFGSHESSYRITLIPNAERMTPQAANSLLKLLEEPPRGWIFFLTAGDPTLILPTVLSRCQTLRLKPFPKERLEPLLKEEDIEPRRASVCARLSHGSWLKARQMAADDSWEKRQTLFEFLKTPIEQINPLVDWAALKPGNLNQLIDQLENILLDLVNASLATSTYVWMNEDGRDALSAHFKNAIKILGRPEAAREFWIARSERLSRARQEALTPMNRKLLVQDLLLPWVTLA